MSHSHVIVRSKHSTKKRKALTHKSGVKEEHGGKKGRVYSAVELEAKKAVERLLGTQNTVHSYGDQHISGADLFTYTVPEPGSTNHDNDHKSWFNEGDTFHSYADFIERQKAYMDSCHVHMFIRGSHNMKSDKVDQTKFPYQSVKFTCYYGVKVQKPRSTGKRSQGSVRKGCPCFMCLGFDPNRGLYELKRCNLEHNHPLDAEEIARIPARRKLKNDELTYIQPLIDLKLSALAISKIARQKFGKQVIRKDISNLVAKEKQKNSPKPADSEVATAVNEIMIVDSSETEAQQIAPAGYRYRPTNIFDIRPSRPSTHRPHTTSGDLEGIVDSTEEQTTPTTVSNNQDNYEESNDLREYNEESDGEECSPDANESASSVIKPDDAQHNTDSASIPPMDPSEWPKLGDTFETYPQYSDLLQRYMESTHAYLFKRDTRPFTTDSGRDKTTHPHKRIVHECIYSPHYKHKKKLDRTGSCPFRVSVCFDLKKEVYVIIRCDLEHNHVLNPNEIVYVGGKRRFKPSGVIESRPLPERVDTASPPKKLNSGVRPTHTSQLGYNGSGRNHTEADYSAGNDVINDIIDGELPKTNTSIATQTDDELDSRQPSTQTDDGLDSRQPSTQTDDELDRGQPSTADKEERPAGVARIDPGRPSTDDLNQIRNALADYNPRPSRVEMKKINSKTIVLMDSRPGGNANINLRPRVLKIVGRQTADENKDNSQAKAAGKDVRLPATPQIVAEPANNAESEPSAAKHPGDSATSNLTEETPELSSRQGKLLQAKFMMNNISRVMSELPDDKFHMVMQVVEKFHATISSGAIPSADEYNLAKSIAANNTEHLEVDTNCVSPTGKRDCNSGSHGDHD